jgi:DNA-damage-inducible protein D
LQGNTRNPVQLCSEIILHKEEKKVNEKNIEGKHHRTFEEIKHSDSKKQEFWMARQLSKILEYAEFRNFLPAIEKAKKACANSDQQVNDHFADYLDMVDIGSGAQRQLENMKLSRYACYLIVQNGDSRVIRCQPLWARTLQGNTINPV